jgi:hypothetical protein
MNDQNPTTPSRPDPIDYGHGQDTPIDPPLHVVIDRIRDEVRIRVRYPLAVFAAIGILGLVLFSVTSMIWLACRRPTTITVQRPAEPDLTPVAIAVQPVSELADFRRMGTNYLIIQSFDDEADAIKLAQKLETKNIACTVEKGLPGWSGKRTFFSVVGMTGFASLKDNNDYSQYVDALKAQKLDPKPYKWRGHQPAALLSARAN